ncbi:hypothetical protein H5V45_03460 [Nocardioides sp. KIGAM211]|uniref:Uncharacterized protein n=1 Tax=Nocardioides luti TaxID=2761101 RepID=A0A7X0RDR8_9ACTN|nr:ribonuclease domain-containing protein [Nocardioides luti]MBB6626372.1 hypothetical protein [Nocardioides luti]
MSTTRTSRRQVVGLVVTALVAVLVWWVQSGDDGATHADDPGGTSQQQTLPSGGATGLDPDSGLPYVTIADLPAEATRTLALIRSEGPYPYDEDGGTFGNYEGLLPDHERGYYREFTVETPGSDDRGARRIIAGDGGELYWTPDHYAHFARIVAR